MNRNVLFLKSKGDGPIDRIINLDLLTSAYPLSAEEGHEGETGTILLLASGHRITMGMAFEVFMDHMEKYIANNYRIELENSAKWHNKRMEDTQRIMEEAMRGAHT